MIFDSLKVDRESWGEDAGKIKGRICVKNDESMIFLNVPEHIAAQMVTLVAELIVEAASEASQMIIQDVNSTLIEHKE